MDSSLGARETVLETFGEDGVMLITLNRPEARNAFNRQMWGDARDALQDALLDNRVRCVVVTGAPGAFTAGQDLKEMSTIDTAQSESENGFSAFMDVLCRFDKPLVAAVNGVGVGIGITLLLHCDYVYIAEGSRLRAPFITLGVVPEAASSYLFPLVLGWRNAVHLLFESDFIDAARAVELGLASELCTTGDVLSRAMDRARRLAAKPLGSLRATKRLLLATRDEQVRAARAREDAAFIGRVGSPENMEAVMAFLSKRAPDFRNVPSTDKE
ncbi:MAG: enoyl-CoA hydratase/isomerase family protein [Candidatus Binatia bacterium]